MIQFKSLFEILLLMKKIDSIPDQFHKVQIAEVYNIGLVKGDHSEDVHFLFLKLSQIPEFQLQIWSEITVGTCEHFTCV